jgi:hypothetical protein
MDKYILLTVLEEAHAHTCFILCLDMDEVGTTLNWSKGSSRNSDTFGKSILMLLIPSFYGKF